MSPPYISLKMLGTLTSLVLLWGIQSTWSFSIIEPKPSGVHQSGQRIPVTLELGNVPGVTKVTYYWYRYVEEMLQELAEERVALVSTAKDTPPFGGNILLPKEAIGAYRLLAVAEQGGRQQIGVRNERFDQESFRFCLNIASMRFVTRNPPTTLMVANSTATVAMILATIG